MLYDIAAKAKIAMFLSAKSSILIYFVSKVGFFKEEPDLFNTLRRANLSTAGGFHLR